MLAGQILNGLIVGSMYALVALGFTLVIGLLHRLNFAHTEVFMAGGFVGVAVAAGGAPIWLAAPASILAGGLGGLAVERIAFRGRRRRTRTSPHRSPRSPSASCCST